MPTLESASVATSHTGSPMAALADGGLFRLHHVGVATHNLERAIGYYRQAFGFRPRGEPIEVPAQHVRVAFLDTASGVDIELVEGVGEKSPVRDILDRTGIGAYHLCYQVDDLSRSIRSLTRLGFFRLRRFDMPPPVGGQFAFLLTPDRQLFELYQAPPG